MAAPRQIYPNFESIAVIENLMMHPHGARMVSAMYLMGQPEAPFLAYSCLFSHIKSLPTGDKAAASDFLCSATASPRALAETIREEVLPLGHIKLGTHAAESFKRIATQADTSGFPSELYLAPLELASPALSADVLRDIMSSQKTTETGKTIVFGKSELPERVSEVACKPPRFAALSFSRCNTRRFK